MDQIAHRQRIVLQYFELRIALNKANGLRDQMTDLEFELRSSSSEEYIIIKSSGAHHGLRIGTKMNDQYWFANDHSKYEELFKYLVEGVNTLNDTNNLKETLTIWLFRLRVI